MIELVVEESNGFLWIYSRRNSLGWRFFICKGVSFLFESVYLVGRKMRIGVGVWVRGIKVGSSGYGDGEGW